MEFPHYTWGYIVVKNHECKSHHVPSLYVRVYRTLTPGNCFCSRSLTIREGISRRSKRVLSKSQFPHYTWGYIDITNGRRTTTPVPSLYVRVYRTENEVLLLWDGSLTIREGISPKRPPKPGHLKFPHYTWGYISVYTVRLINDGVPSLYVRVYRREKSWM